MRRWTVASMLLTAGSLCGCGQSAGPVAPQSATSVSVPASTVADADRQAQPPGQDVQTVAVSTREPARLAPPPAISEESLSGLKPVPTGSSEPIPSDAIFERLIAATEGGSPDDWTAAEQELQAVGADALPTLVRHLSDDNSAVREMAVMFIAQIGPAASSAAPALEQVLDDSSPLVQVNAASTILVLGDQPAVEGEADGVATAAAGQRVTAAVRVLCSLLDAPEEQIRLTAISALGNAGSAAEPALPQLVALLQDDNPRIRGTAATTLGRLGPIAAGQANALRPLAKDADEEVRQAAALAWRQLRPARQTGEAIPASATE